MLQHLPVVCPAQGHRDTLGLEAQQEDLQGQLCQERWPWEGSARSAPSVVALEGQHSEILVWNMEESPLPEEEVACPGSIFVWLCLSGLV